MLRHVVRYLLFAYHRIEVPLRLVCRRLRVEIRDDAACETHLGLAETVPGPSSDAIAALAREHDLYVIFGLPERDAEDSKKLYNAAAVIGPDGVIGTLR